MPRFAVIILVVALAGPVQAETSWTRPGWYRIEIFPALKLLGGPFATAKACRKTLPKVEDDVVRCARLAKAGDEIDVALAFFEQAIKENPRNASAMNYRGLLFARRGETDKAIAEHTKAIEANPDDYWAFVFRGKIYQQLGKRKEAEADFREALARNPGDTSTVEMIKNALREVGAAP